MNETYQKLRQTDFVRGGYRIRVEVYRDAKGHVDRSRLQVVLRTVGESPQFVCAWVCQARQVDLELSLTWAVMMVDRLIG